MVTEQWGFFSVPNYCNTGCSRTVSLGAEKTLPFASSTTCGSVERRSIFSGRQMQIWSIYQYHLQNVTCFTWINIHLIMGVCPGCHSSGGWGGGMSYITHHYNVFRYIHFEFRGFYVWNFSWIFIQVSFVKRFCHIASHRMPNYYKDFAEFLHWLLLLFLIQLQRKRSIQNIYAYWI